MQDATRSYGSMPAIDDLDSEDTTLDASDTIESDLDALRAELSVKVQVDELTVKVKRRPGWATIHRLDFTAANISEWDRKSTVKGRLNAAKMNGLGVAQTCVGIMKDGKRILDDDGRPWTLTHPEVRELMGAPDAWQTARAFFGHDADLTAAGKAIVEAAGYGEDAEEADPTEL